MRVLIVDDEAPARAKLRRLLGGEADVEIAGEAAGGAEAVAAIRRERPDVVFLDIQMPGLDGFGVIREVGVAAMPVTVFVTAHDDRALDAFEAEALDYVLKPVAPARFARVVERLRERLARPAGDVVRRIERLLERAGGERGGRLLVERPDGRASVFIRPDEIEWIEAQRNDVEIHAGGRVWRLRMPIGDVEARLGSKDFLRISRSHIVRLDRVRELQPWFHGELKVVLRDGPTLTWTRRYRKRS
ncbi:MAG TPA: LytTR family DNA-binding domain-containing protein [Vicinamibacterales bacterium]|nr:LytTR family DNA-binding domain-containing protein [Vicinamibacterales bacterium]